MPADLAFQLEIALRLLVAAVLGAAIGLEREIHEHPAGMRTHLLVSLGSAIFTVVGVVGFVLSGSDASLDPSRVAAQVVSGIGFLGAGAILKYGTSIRGLTTAASLWATAAVGLAVGAGAWVIGIVGTVIVIVSLWPLRIVVARLGVGRDRLRLRLSMEHIDALGRVTAELHERRVEIVTMQTERRRHLYEVELELRIGTVTKVPDLVDAIRQIRGVDILETVQSDD